MQKYDINILEKIHQKLPMGEEEVATHVRGLPCLNSHLLILKKTVWMEKEAKQSEGPHLPVPLIAVL